MSDRPDVPAGVAPLSMTEEAAWRALARAIQVVPRVLEVDLLEAQGLSVTEYTVLMNLSEAPGGSMRMKELADHVTISVSGLTRAVSRLERDGRVRRVRSRQDGRGQVACLTRAGQECLERAWPAHLASVRRHVVDHLAGVDLLALTTAMDRIGEVDPGPPAGGSPAGVLGDGGRRDPPGPRAMVTCHVYSRDDHQGRFESVDDIIVTNDRVRARYEARVGGQHAGFAEYQLTDALVVFTHTEVDRAFEGQGIGSALARFALDDVRREGTRSVLPLCPFIKGWIARHRDYVDLVYDRAPSVVHD